MFPWPHLDLTDYERQWVRHYQTGRYAGVLKRVYRADLTSQPTTGFPTPQFQDDVQIARYSRVFALVFQGDMGSWRLRIQTSGGETFTATEPRTNVFPLVSSMVPGTLYNEAGATIGIPPVADNRQNQKQFGALLIEPNWVLAPNTTLQFIGNLAEAVPDPDQDQRFLSIGVHVWEFPGVDVAAGPGPEMTQGRQH